MPKILVTPRSLTRGGDPALDVLRAAGFELVCCTPGKAPGEEELATLVPGCIGWLAGVEKITDAVLAKASALKVISRNGTGVDAIDLEACRSRGIAVVKADGANARGVAELTLGLILSLLRSIPLSDSRMKAGGWERRQGGELEGKCLGVVGTGRIGRLVTRFALALDMTVIAHDAYPDAALEGTSGFRYASLAELLASSDIVTLHCPPLPGGLPLIGREELGSMKKGSCLVNTARAGLVDSDTVLAALNEGRLAGYAVDAYDREPPDPHPLYAHDRVIATPHIGAFTAESVARATRAAVDNLLAALHVR
jgi:D-3-phosphoglycerate dehydrogenase